MLNNFFYIYIKAYFSNGKAGDILMFNSNAVWRVFHYPLPSHVSVKNQKLSWATATGPFSKPISTCQSKAMNSGEHLDDPCRNSAFCFFMFSVSWVRSNKTFYFSLLSHEIGTFSPQNKLFFFALLLFAQFSLDTWKATVYSTCRVLVLTRSAETLPKSREPLRVNKASGWLCSEEGWAKEANSAFSSSVTYQSLNVSEVINSSLCLFFLVKRGYFTACYQWWP